MIRPFSIFLFISALWISAKAEAVDKVFLLNTANDCPNATESFDGIADRIVREAFNRLNLPLRQIRLISERALHNANEGIDDGNYSRIQGIENQYPNLIRVPESIIQFEFVAFSRNKNISIKSWASLGKYNIALIRGWKILETNIKRYKSLFLVNDEKQLFKMLNAGRVDIIVYEKTQGICIINKHKYQSIYALNKSLAVKDMYLYMHKRNSLLVPAISLTFQKMKADGTFAKIRREVEKKYLKFKR